MKLLFVYGFEPSGHASAARALEAAAADAGDECLRVNVAGDFNRVLGPLVARVYLGVVARLPGLWKRLYDNEPVARIVACWRVLYDVFFGARMRQALRELDPDVVVCTHAPPLAALALERERGGFSWPLAAVVTDYRVHTYWLAPRAADLYVTASEDARLPPERVVVAGIPIHPDFERPPSREQARARLGLPAGVPVVVVSGGSRGLGLVARAADAVLERLPRARVLAVCGSNARLAGELKARAKAAEGRLWVFESASPRQMVELKSAADVLIGKAGGVTAAECLALKLPFVILEPLPGQERRNADFLLERGAAVEASSPLEAADEAARLLEPAARAALLDKADALARPGSARAALEAIRALRRVRI